MQAAASQPKIKHKSFTFETNLRWIGGRTAYLQSDGKPDLRVSSPPQFKGESGVWTPEDMFVASVEACLLTTFVAFAQRGAVPVISYTSQAEGLLEFVDGDYRITRVVVKPTILIDHPDAASAAAEAVHAAHEKCLIGNSITTEIVVEPHIEVLNVS